MKKISTLASIILLIVVLTIYVLPKEENYPAPTNGNTLINSTESEDSQNKREAWIERMHAAAPGTSWRAIEAKTSEERYQKRLKNRNSEQKNGEEILANGQLVGEWFERGSNNQSGNVGVTEYDPETDEIYLVSGGGSLFKGLRDGSNWTVVNQDLRFSDRFLKLIKVNGNKRLLSAVDRVPHYSDDMGKTWTKSSGILSSFNDWQRILDPVVVEVNGTQQVYFLSKPGYWENIRLYGSIDNGESYQEIKEFSTHEGNRFALCKPHHTAAVYLFEKNGSAASTISQIDLASQQLIALGASSFGIGGANASMTGTLMENGDTRLFVFDDEDLIHRTDDFGQTWAYTSKLPKRPWEIGIYVSKFKTNRLYSGEVECHRATGIFWTTVNGWGEYYDDVEGKLHADIMYFNEFETADGTPFALVSNHGGLSISYDNLETTQNIGLEGLNVSQYYDVRTDPRNPAYLYAGTQDQGFQRGFASSSTDIVDFDQIISGDYGHIAFSNNGASMWTVYPGGDISHYINAQIGGLSSSYNIDSDNESVWIPPVIETPDPTDNAVLVAGGNINGGQGSHIIHMRIWAGSIQATQLPFDFKAASTGEVSAIEVSPMNDDLMYASTTNGFFYYSYDGGQTWEQSFVFVPEPHYLYGTSIYASTIDENTVYIAGSGYSNAAVYVSTDNGKTFAPMNDGLPSTLVFEIVANEDESLFFAGTEAGPYVYVVNDGKWYDMMGDAAPNQTYWSVEYLAASQTVRFGTHGRGIWDFQIQEPVSTEAVVRKTDVLRVYPNPSAGIIHVSSSIETNSPVEFRIFDMKGQLLERKTSTSASNESFDLQKYPSGTYIVQLQTGTQLSKATFVLE